MPITYYAQTADKDHWSTAWGQKQLDHLLAVAARDPLSRHLEAHMPTSGLILEGGCGLGQYVLFLRQQGYHVVGGDFSVSALRIHRQVYLDSPLRGLDLRRMPYTDNAFQAGISLGVVEHTEEGPQEMLHEFYRTLAPGGVFLLSVPWVNGARRLLAPFIRRRQAQRQAAGATFHQYAFTCKNTASLSHCIRLCGACVLSLWPWQGRARDHEPFEDSHVRPHVRTWPAATPG